MDKNAKIYIAGHKGLAGSAIMRRLKKEGYTNILIKEHRDLDLRQQADVRNFFKMEKPEYVILCAAAVGGIHANTAYPARFIYDNLAIQINVIHSAYEYGVKKLLFFGSSCAYPKECGQPMKEEYLMSGYLEPTSEPYAVAKIAGIKMCQAYGRQYGVGFISAIPANLYGPHDNFDPERAHVIPGLIRKFHTAKTKKEPHVSVWGTGRQMREFLHVDDLAQACLFLMNHYDSPEVINIGAGIDYSIKDLSHMIKDIAGYDGEIVFDASKPDGFPKKMLDTSRLNSLGWTSGITLQEGLRQTYSWYFEHLSRITKIPKDKTEKSHYCHAVNSLENK